MKPMEAMKLAREIALGSLKYLISWLYPKNRNLWVFGAWFGEKYSDNSKYLFEYVLKHHPNIDAVWITNNDQATLVSVSSASVASLIAAAALVVAGFWFQLKLEQRKRILSLINRQHVPGQ